MPKKSLEVLTESMFYLLMAFRAGPLCGIDAAGLIEAHTGGRVTLGPATLYTILRKFEEVGYLREVSVEGRKRTYQLTDLGREAYEAEVERLRLCLADSRREMEGGAAREGEKDPVPAPALSGL